MRFASNGSTSRLRGFYSLLLIEALELIEGLLDRRLALDLITTIRRLFGELTRILLSLADFTLTLRVLEAALSALVNFRYFGLI